MKATLRTRRRTDAAHLPFGLDGREVTTFAVIGVLCTVMYAVFYAALRVALPAVAANVLALIPTMAANFWANRTITFRSSHGALARQAGGYAIAYLLGLGASEAVFTLLLYWLQPHSVAAEALTGIAAGFVATALRFVLMSHWVFRNRAASSHSIQGQAGAL